MSVSVIVPAFDAQDFIAQTLRSARDQTAPPLEIIVVDDGSRDRTPEIARGFGPSVRVVRSPGKGACAARIEGARLARGDALMFLDADDLLGPTVLEELSAALAARPGAVACCPWRRLTRVDGCWREAPASCAPRRPGDDELCAWLRGWYHPPCSILWSRAAYEASGGWDPGIASNQDGDMMMRALLAGAPLQATAGGIAFYRRLPGEAVSLSGRRFTRTGLESRLSVLERVEDLAVRTGRIASCRAALADAYAALGETCSDEMPDLRARAAEGERRAGGARRGMARRLDHALDRLRRDRRPAPLAPVARPAPAPDRPVPAAGDPLVTVVVPTYDRSATVAVAIRSVLAQTYETVELLVVDDASRDDTADVVAGFADPRVRCLRQPTNRGVAAARNRGIREARGDLIAFLDSDDAWAPDKLRRQVDLVRRRPSCVGLVYTGLTVIGEAGVRTTWTPRARGVVWRDMLHTNVVHFGTSSTLVRREALEAVGLFDETLPANEDYDLWIRIARFYELDVVPDPLTTYCNAGGDGGPEERRSRNFAANMRARRTHLDRWGTEMRAAGVGHLFHLDCARRHLESPYGSAWAARLHLLKAVRAAPREPRLALWLAFSMLPTGLRRRSLPSLARARRALPARLWLGRRGGADAA